MIPPSSEAVSLAEALTRLEAVVMARRGADPASSYTAQLLADPSRAAKKFGEEAVETLIAALSHDAEAVANESADLLYHWMVLLTAAGVSTQAVANSLASREGQSGLEEKAARSR